MTDRTPTVGISKIAPDQRLVFGWANICRNPDGTVVKDLQGDVIPDEELELASYRFLMHKDGTLGYRHQKDAGGKPIRVGKIVEMCVFTKEKCAAMGIPDGVMPTGIWIGAYVEDDATWALVKSGELRMFSLGGAARAHEVNAS